MIIEIPGADLLNKGAELMLLTIIECLRRRYPDALLTAVPSDPRHTWPYAKLVDLRLYPKASIGGRDIEFGDAVGLDPQRLRRRYGLLLDREVDVVLDASGFAYSDRWGATAVQELARSARRWRHRGTPVILLPRAFGPLEDPAIRKAVTRALDNADLVMPGDAPIVSEQKPLVIKGILSACRAVVASRFHALVSACCPLQPAGATSMPNSSRTAVSPRA